MTNCKLCTLHKHIPFLMDDSKRWKAYFYENGDPCKYFLFAGSDKVPDGDPVSPNGAGMAGGNWAFMTTLTKCDYIYKNIVGIGQCDTNTKYLNQGIGITPNAQSSKLSLVGTTGSSSSKFNVQDIGLGGIQEWSLPKYLEPNKEKWGSIFGHQKIYPELSPPYTRGPRLGIRTAHIFLGMCPPCEDACCNCKLLCAEGVDPPIYNDGVKIKKSPCELPCSDPYTQSIGKSLGYEDTCFCVAPTPVSNTDYVTFLNTIAKNDIFGGDNSGFTQIVKDQEIDHEDKDARLDLWNIDMFPAISRDVTNDSIHKYIYRTNLGNFPVVNVTFYAAKWYIKWMRSDFVNPFKFSKLQLDNDPTKINCDDAVLELINADYKWDYNPLLSVP